MKNINHLLISITMFLLSVIASAQYHDHHTKHNMILFGTPGTYYASHIVYKAPHNFQVILMLNLSEDIKGKIVSEVQYYPDDQLIYLLDQMDISQIESKPPISGQVFRTSSDGVKHMILEKMELQSNQYDLIYFDELPLSLDETKYQSKSALVPTNFNSIPIENCHKIKCQ